MSSVLTQTEHRMIALSASMLSHLWRRLSAKLRNHLQAPDAGEKPRDIRVSSRAWKRNSALLMSLYRQDRP